MRIALPASFFCEVDQPSRAARWVELLLVYGVSPLLVVSDLWPARLKMPLLGLAMVLTVIVAARRRADRALLGFGRQAFRGAVWSAGLLWGGAFLAAITTAAVMGWPVLPLPRQSPWFFAALSIMYLPSVIAQEWLFRSYFFWRYADLLPRPSLVAVNVLLFGWIHIVFGSWISVALSAAGGLAFTLVYLRHRSFWGLVVFHALIGLSVFALGLERFFMSGTLELLNQFR